MKHFICALLLVFAAAYIAIPRVSYAQGVDVDAKAIDKAVKKGVEHLKGLVNPDGSFITSNALEKKYPEGTTALVLFALLKSGMVNRNDKLIINGFRFIRSKPYTTVYSVSLLILALEARYAPKPKPAAAPRPKPEKKSKKGMATVPSPPAEKVAKDNFKKKASPDDRRLLNSAVRWLLSKQQANIWRYPGGSPGGTTPENGGSGPLSGMEDFSNTQYAMLALNAARRLGYPIQSNVWLKAADYCFKNQEKTGPEVKWFPVPAADFPIAKLRKMRDQYLKELTTAIKKHNKEVKKAHRQGKDPEAVGLTKDGPRTSVTKPDPYKEKKFGDESLKMYARGWAYLPKDTKYQSGSMTTSGVATLIICKDALEFAGKYKAIQKKADKAIRDGCAWLARHFTIRSNPRGRGAWHYYYLYGLERAGVLSLVREFGKHKWYEQGVKYLLSAQQGNGAWTAGGQSSELVNTCFALLFLKRATTPIIGIPEESGTFTGSDLFGSNRHDK
jgi:hypothetical protein